MENSKTKPITVRLPLDSYRAVQRLMASRLNAGQEAMAGTLCRELILKQLVTEPDVKEATAKDDTDPF